MLIATIPQSLSTKGSPGNALVFEKVDFGGFFKGFSKNEGCNLGEKLGWQRISGEILDF